MENQGREYTPDENRINVFETESDVRIGRHREKEKSKRKGLREARRRGAHAASSHSGLDMEDWIESEARVLATQIQAELQQQLVKSERTGS